MQLQAAGTCTFKTLEKAGIKTWHKLYFDNSTIEEGNHQRYVYDFFATDDDNDNPASQNTGGRSRKSSNQSKVVPPIRASMTSMDFKTSDPFDESEDSLKQKSVVLSLTEYLNFEADHFEEIKAGYLFLIAVSFKLENFKIFTKIKSSTSL